MMILKTISFLERAGCNGGGKGILVTEERTNCLATILQPKVCYEVLDEKDDISDKQQRDKCVPPLDSHYYKGQGQREGIEREFVVLLDDSLPDGESSDGLKD